MGAGGVPGSHDASSRPNVIAGGPPKFRALTKRRGSSGAPPPTDGCVDPDWTRAGQRRSRRPSAPWSLHRDRPVSASSPGERNRAASTPEHQACTRARGRPFRRRRPRSRSTWWYSPCECRGRPFVEALEVALFLGGGARDHRPVRCERSGHRRLPATPLWQGIGTPRPGALRWNSCFLVYPLLEHPTALGYPQAVVEPRSCRPDRSPIRMARRLGGRGRLRADGVGDDSLDAGAETMPLRLAERHRRSPWSRPCGGAAARGSFVPEPTSALGRTRTCAPGSGGRSGLSTRSFPLSPMPLSWDSNPLSSPPSCPCLPFDRQH